MSETMSIDKLIVELRAGLEGTETWNPAFAAPSSITIGTVRTLLDALAATQEDNRRLRDIIRLCDRQLLALYNSISPHAEYVTSDGKSGNRFADQDAAIIAARSLYQDEANAPPISPRRAE
jgi:hypothetical protein